VPRLEAESPCAPVLQHRPSHPVDQLFSGKQTNLFIPISPVKVVALRFLT